MVSLPVSSLSPARRSPQLVSKPGKTVARLAVGPGSETGRGERRAKKGDNPARETSRAGTPNVYLTSLL